MTNPSERPECERCDDPALYNGLCLYHERQREMRDDEWEDWEECSNCGGEGIAGHDCGEDTCCCLRPEENMTCYICEGKGGWNRAPITVSTKRETV